MADTKADNGVNSSIAQYIETMSMDTEGTLKSIYLTLQAIAKKDGIAISQSSLQDLVAAEQSAQEANSRFNNTDRRGAYADRQARSEANRNSRSNNQRNNNSRNRNQNQDKTQPNKYTRGDRDLDEYSRKKSKSFIDQISDSFEKGLTASFKRDNPVSKILESSLQGLADKLGTDINGLGNEVGLRLGKLAGDAFKNSRIGNRLTREWQGVADRFGARFSQFTDSIGNRLADINVDDLRTEAENAWRADYAKAKEEAANAEQARRFSGINQPQDASASEVQNATKGSTAPLKQEFEGKPVQDVEVRPAEETSTEAARTATQNVVDESVNEVKDSVDISTDRVTSSVSNLQDAVNVSSTEMKEYLSNLYTMVDNRLSALIELWDGTPDDLNKLSGAVSNTPEVHEGRPEDIPDTMGDILNNTVENSETTSTALANLGRGANTASRAMNAASRASNVTGTALTTVTEGLSAMTPVAGSASNALASMSGAVGAAGAAFPILTVGLLVATEAISNTVSKAAGYLKEGWKEFSAGLTKAVNRGASQNAQAIESWNARVKADLTSLREAAYNVIKDAANQVTSTWDNILTTVSATQGYDKAGVQELWSSYAERLTEEGLASTVSSADIMEKLNSVLGKGLSGAVAEEFAYTATLLSNAIPTEDFFQYADTYASIAATALKRGASEQEAIQQANAELTEFANNLLYASRQIAGGFTTSLTNASDLFSDAAKIAAASRTDNVSEISGVLTSVSAIVGTMAPDLANSLVETVVSAATGGNSSELTALRSLAGVGASNTAFLQEFVKAPQTIFETLFRNLSQLQNMSAANYMEVAESLSSVFGISMDAFARVDFAYLADAIAGMNLQSSELNKNMALLANGQTTSTASQLRMQKINEYMVEEGLAYVLDNEVAREIQQHMWDEQLAREIESATYAVEFASGAEKLLNGIANAVDTILDLTPIGVSRKLDNLIATAKERDQQTGEIKEVLERGLVGTGSKSGTQTALKNLTSGETNLNLATSYVELLGGQARETYQPTTTASQAQDIYNWGMEAGQNFVDWISGSTSGYVNSANAGLGAAGSVTDIVNAPVVNSQDAALGAATAATKKSAATAFSSNKAGKAGANSYYTHRLISKSSAASTAISGDRSTDYAFNPYYHAFEDVTTPTAVQAATFSSNISDSLTNYVNSLTNLEQAKQQNLSSKVTTEKTDGILTRAAFAIDQAAAKIITNAKGEEVSREISHRDFYTQEELLEQVLNDTSTQKGSFKEWSDKFEQEWNKQNPSDRYKHLEEILADYDLDISTIERAYLQQEALNTSAATRARELHEVQFWEDMQQFATKDFPSYMREWERYYIRHEAYGQVTAGAYSDESGKALTEEALANSQGVASLLRAENEGQGDAILALAQTLTDNETYRNKTLSQLMDPQLQTNALLSKILLVAEAIMQQNNESAIVSVPTSLSSLGLGTTNI